MAEQPSTAFTSKLQEGDTETGRRHLRIEAQPRSVETNTSNYVVRCNNVISRRIAMFSITSAMSTLLVPTSVFGLQIEAATDLLECTALGGHWKQYDRSFVHNSGTFTDVPAPFCTYFTRFLIQYDKMGFGPWWDTEVNTSRFLSPRKRDAKLARSFAAIAKSLQRSVQVYIGEKNAKERYSELWDTLENTYGEEPDAMRHIALLFSLLPSDQQPSKRLEVYFDRFEPGRITNKILESGKVESNDFTKLLPGDFHLSCTSASHDTNGGTFKCTPTPIILLDDQSNGDVVPAGATLSVFGPIDSQPLTRERSKFSWGIYGLIALAGSASCTLTHAVVIPLDVVKTRSQTDPKINTQLPAPNRKNKTQHNNRILDAGWRIFKDEGLSGLFLGAQATLVGYFWYGLSVYPSYTFFKRYITQLPLPSNYATTHMNEISLIAGAIAATIASFGLTPIEAARIRVVAQPDIYRSLGLLGTLAVIAKEDSSRGWINLYAGLPSLLTRQVIFGSVKFLAFELGSDLIYSAWPLLGTERWTQLIVCLLAGGFAGALSSVVSQPADSALTYISASRNTSSSLSSIGLVNRMIVEEGAGSLFRGLGSRCVWSTAIIAGQFLLYDIVRSALKIAVSDLSQVYELSF